MTERAEMMTREQILTNFPPQEEVFDAGKNGKVVDGKVTYLVSRDPNGLILYAVPETEWFKRGEQSQPLGLREN